MQALIKYIATLLLLLISLSAYACFGPKLYIGTHTGEEGELLYHLVAVYLKEKTGVESLRVELTGGQTVEALLQQEKIDFGFSPSSSGAWPQLLSFDQQLYLLHGPRPVEDLQFTTVPKALQKLQARLQDDDLKQLRQQVASGLLPAKAVRSFYMQRGWI